MTEDWRPASRPLLIAGLVVLLIGALTMADRITRNRAVAGVAQRSRASVILLAASFRRELDKFRLVPIVLADDREAREALTTRDPARLAALNRKLEALSRETHAANVYLLDARGITVAASNWQQPESFLGDDYAFRTYYREAMRRGDAQQFALGRRSREPGLYISKRLSRDGRPLGVFVVKVEFGGLEREWRETATSAFVTDTRGIMLVTANPAWRFQTIRPLSPAERMRARRSLEYGAVPLAQNPLFAAHAVAAAGSAAAMRAPYVEATERVGDRWQVHVVSPTASAVDGAVAFTRLVFLFAVLAGAAGWLVWRQRRRAAAARAERATNARLAVLNDQLVQANKLATLGQITAGVGHEINQPVTAIAAYAHTARMLIAREAHAEAIEAIDRIAALTQRIGIITRELRGFARRASGEITAVAIDEAVAGVALLLRHRLTALGVDFVVSGPALSVRAERVRLEQVLVNLVQNALDAGAMRVAVETRAVGARVEIAVVDDGTGLSPEIRTGLFQPFRTSKHDGLGLGLVLCHDIVTRLGGTLEARAPAAGAEFVIILERA